MLAGVEAAGEGDQVHPGVGRQRRPGTGPVAQHQVGHAGRHAGLLQQAHQVDRRVGGELARLEHEGVARGQAGCHLPGDLQQRVVPRRDQGAHAHRLADHAGDHVGPPGVHRPFELLTSDPAEVPEDGGDVVDVVPALHQSLARVEGLRSRQRGPVPLEQVGHGEEHVGACGRGGAGPGAAVEGTAGGGDRGFGVDRSGLVDLPDQGAVSRAVDLAAASGARGQPAPLDVDSATATPPGEGHPGDRHHRCWCCVWRTIVLLSQRPSLSML